MIDDKAAPPGIGAAHARPTWTAAARAAGPASDRPKPFAACPTAALQAVRGVFTDIDDTLTEDGRLMPEAASALQALADAGVPVIALTGRPLGWSAERTAEWPLVAVVAENGGVARVLRGLDPGRPLAGTPRVWDTLWAQGEAERAAHQRRLQAAAQRVLKALPEARLATDSPGRVTDIAIDHAEHAHLSPAAIAEAVRLLQADGLTVTVSSIHINAWFGAHSKVTGAAWMLEHCFGSAWDEATAHWLYVGDSPNDQAMFAALPLSVGVANLQEHAAALTQWPAYQTKGARGVGFAEVAQRLLAVRAGRDAGGPTAP